MHTNVGDMVIPGRPAELPKGGVSDTSITCSGIHRRGMQSVRRVGFGFSIGESGKSARAHTRRGVATAKMNRESIEILAVKVFVRPSIHGA